MTVRLRKGGLRLSHVGTLCTLGTPQDVTLEALRIKLFFPTDPDSAGTFARIAEGRTRGPVWTPRAGSSTTGPRPTPGMRRWRRPP